jgi:myosin heavy subunit
METMKSKQNFTAWAIVAIIGLLALNGYQWFNNNQLKTENVQQLTQTEELQKVQVELDQDYQAALESLEQLRGQNTEANAMIDAQKKELGVQKQKINELVTTKRDLGKARDEMKKLTSQASDYVSQINKLLEENKSLNQQNEILSTDLQAEKKSKEEISQARATLSSEKESLSKSNEVLSSKVDMANAIKINFMNTKGYEVNKDGKLKEKSKGKDMDIVKFCFKTESNYVTPAGTKKFYIRLISPTGETIAIENKGSGVLTNKLDNTQVRYTTSGEVSYQNKDTEGCVDWTLDSPLSKGMHEVEMYNNGFMVGKGSFQVK